MRDKAIIIVLFVASIILISAFFIITPSYITDNGDSKHFEDNDLAFDMMKSWTVYEYDDPIKTPFLSSSPSSIILTPVDSSEYSYNTQNLSTENDVINTATTNAFDVVIMKTEISKVDSLPEGITLDNAYKSDSLYSLMESSGKFDIVNDTSMTISNRPAHQFIYRVSGISYFDTWIEKDGHYFRVLSEVSNSFLDEAQPQFDYLIQTLTIK